MMYSLAIARNGKQASKAKLTWGTNMPWTFCKCYDEWNGERPNRKVVNSHKMFDSINDNNNFLDIKILEECCWRHAL